MNKMEKIPDPVPSQLKSLKIVSGILSIVVLLLVGLMRRVKIDLGVDFSFLPPVNAICNTLVAIFLVLAVVKIKQKDWVSHQKYIYAAMTFSAMFLLCYVLYHFTTPEVKYCNEDGTMRMIYFFFLITHIVLAAVSLPFILLTFSYGLTFHTDKHRKIARWVFPIWLYVAITGPICYLLLRPCYE
jgi:putative membrane protein